MSLLLEPAEGRQVFTLSFQSQPADRWAWIALRHEVDYRRALLPHETAHGRTWVADAPDGPRFVRIDAADGAMCAQVRTTWCLVEQATGRPRRVPAWIGAMFG